MISESYLPEKAVPARRDNVARNVLITLVGQVLSWILSILILRYVPRYLGDDILGKLANAESVLYILGVMISLGTSAYVVKEISRAPERLEEILAASLLIRIPLGAVATLLALAVGYALHWHHTTIVFLGIVSLSTIVNNYNELFIGIHQGLGEFRRQNLFLLLDRLVYTVTILILLKVDAGYQAIVACSVFSAMLQMVLHLSFFRKYLVFSPARLVPAMRDLVCNGLQFVGWMAFRQINGYIAPIILSILATDSASGWYNIAFRLMGTTMFFPMALVMSFTPMMARVHSQYPLKKEDFHQISRRMLEMMVLYGIPIGAILTSSPLSIIEIFNFGERFWNAAPAIAAVGIGLPFYFVNMAVTTIANTYEKQAEISKISGKITIFSVIMSCLLIHLCHVYLKNGSIGAIFSGIFSEIIMIYLIFKIIPKNMFDLSVIKWIIKCIISSIPIYIFANMNIYPIISIILGSLCYLTLCITLRCIDRSYLYLIINIVQKKQSDL